MSSVRLALTRPLRLSNRTNQHKDEFVPLANRQTFRSNYSFVPRSLHTLSKKLITPAAEYDPPPPAAARIVMKPFTEQIKQSWNDKVGGLYALTRKEGARASSWGRRVLYGGDAGAGKANPPH